MSVVFLNQQQWNVSKKEVHFFTCVMMKRAKAAVQQSDEKSKGAAMLLNTELDFKYQTVYRLLKRGTADALRWREVAVETGLYTVGVVA